jgi:hypothetical protein
LLLVLHLLTFPLPLPLLLYVFTLAFIILTLPKKEYLGFSSSAAARTPSPASCFALSSLDLEHGWHTRLRIEESPANFLVVRLSKDSTNTKNDEAKR